MKRDQTQAAARIGKSPHLRYLGIAAAILTLLVILGLPEATLVTATAEDGGIEYASALAWFIGFVLCALALRRASKRDRWLLVGWMALCFVCMGEEVSWFQRVIGFATPEPVFGQNLQQEVTLHNLPFFAPEGQSWREALATGDLDPALLLNINKLFVLGMCGYFLGLPALMRWRWTAALLERFGYRPVSRMFPIVLTVGLAASYAIVIGTSLPYTHAISEIRELFLAGFALAYVTVLSRQSMSSPPIPTPATSL